MKKFLVTFALLFAVVNIMAQEHLSFKGIPIEGSLTEFCQKLEAKGFTKKWRSGSATAFEGDFTGLQLTIAVEENEDENSVHSVIVIFNESREWKSLDYFYNYYKDLYIRKYGEPSTCQEDNLNLDAGNSYIMHQLAEGRIKYKSVWTVSGGDIELYINGVGTCGGGLIIHYKDAKYEETKINKDLEDI